MAGAVEAENDTAKRKNPEPVTNGAAQATDEEAPEAKRRSVIRSCIHEVALPPGQYMWTPVVFRSEFSLIVWFLIIFSVISTLVLAMMAKLTPSSFVLAYFYILKGFKLS